MHEPLIRYLIRGFCYLKYAYPKAGDMTPTLSKGFYRHYKGRYYEVLDLVRHSETEEWLVLYRTCYGDESRWVRPFTMFTETITLAGVEQARFAYVGNTRPVDAELA